MVLVRRSASSPPVLVDDHVQYSNFVVALTFPALVGAFTPQGAFGWYAAWNVIGFVLALLLVPETKALTLEELDAGTLLLVHSTSTASVDALYCSFLRTIAGARALSTEDVFVALRANHEARERRAQAAFAII